MCVLIPTRDCSGEKKHPRTVVAIAVTTRRRRRQSSRRRRIVACTPDRCLAPSVWLCADRPPTHPFAAKAARVLLLDTTTNSCPTVWPSLAWPTCACQCLMSAARRHLCFHHMTQMHTTLQRAKLARYALISESIGVKSSALCVPLRVSLCL